MYIPTKFKSDDLADAISFMKKFSFGTIITSSKGKPIATHLPFVIQEKNGNVTLTSHFAKANKQGHNFQEKEILVIFTEPNAYISPKLYTKKENVPTWNYISIHVYGRAKILEGSKEVFNVLELMIKNFDTDGYENQWNELSQDYKDSLAKGIIAFEIQIHDIQFKEKLSQNKSKTDRKRIIESLSNSKNSNEVFIAAFMKKKE